MRSTNMYCSSHCISVSSDVAIGYAPQCLAIPPHVQSNYRTHAMGSTVRGSNAGRGKLGFLFSKTQRPALGPTQLRIQYVPGFFRGVTLTTQFHRVPRLRMSGALPLLPLYAFMACAGAAVYFDQNFLNYDRTM
jgi:hypothetical protein